MKNCDYCGTLILFGGQRLGNLRFCNEECLRGGSLLVASQQIPDRVIYEYMHEVHRGNCPHCGRRGPIDVHTSYRVWSALVWTQWSSRPQVSCKSCSVKRQLQDSAFCLCLGWWGIPWGFIFTPLQLWRNLAGLLGGPNPLTPSPLLDRFVRLHLAQQLPQDSGIGHA